MTTLIEEGPWSAWFGPKGADLRHGEPLEHGWSVRARSTGTADPFVDQRIVAKDLTLDEARLLSAVHEMRELTRLVATYFEGSIPGAGKGSQLGEAARRILGRWSGARHADA